VTTRPGGDNNIPPFRGSPLCEDHNNDTFHTLWNSLLGCHYDHEHGSNPFTEETTLAFPAFDLFRLLGNVEIGHTNPSSPMENTHKHGGFKWDVALNIPCESFEGNQFCVTAAVIQYHAFGDYSIEMEARNHSTAALLKVCRFDNVSDCGYLYTVQLQEYGQRVSQYQGEVIPYPNNPDQAYDSPRGPYFTIDRYGACTGCRPSLAYVKERNLNANSIWTSKPTGQGIRPQTSSLFGLLFRVRDTYQLIQYPFGEYPFTFGWVCGGAVYIRAGCKYNNTTTKVHEVMGEIPDELDNLAGFDINPQIGRITATGYTDRYGTLLLDCAGAGGECHPIKLVNMFVGLYGGALPGAKVSNPDKISNPERDICFTAAGVLINCDLAGAIPAGWIGSEN
jgi:hypothetical protein